MQDNAAYEPRIKIYWRSFAALQKFFVLEERCRAFRNLWELFYNWRLARNFLYKRHQEYSRILLTVITIRSELKTIKKVQTNTEHFNDCPFPQKRSRHVKWHFLSSVRFNSHSLKLPFSHETKFPTINIATFW